MKRIMILTLILGSLSTDVNSSSFTLIDPQESRNHPANSVKVFGFGQRDALAMDGDPNGKACSYEHKDDDLSNRWCHAMVAKLGSHYLQKMGFSTFSSALLSSLIFVPKEFLYDKNPSMADLVAVEIPLYTFDDYSGGVDLTVFGDGGGVLSIEKVF